MKLSIAYNKQFDRLDVWAGEWPDERWEEESGVVWGYKGEGEGRRAVALTIYDLKLKWPGRKFELLGKIVGKFVIAALDKEGVDSEMSLRSNGAALQLLTMGTVDDHPDVQDRAQCSADE